MEQFTSAQQPERTKEGGKEGGKERGNGQYNVSATLLYYFGERRWLPRRKMHGIRRGKGNLHHQGQHRFTTVMSRARQAKDEARPIYKGSQFLKLQIPKLAFLSSIV